MKKIKKLLSAAIIFTLLSSCLSFGIPVNALEEVTSNREGISYMPPNPEVYPDFYSNGGTGSGKRSASVNNSLPMVERVADKEYVPDAGDVEKLLVIPVNFSNVSFSSGHDSTYYGTIMDSMRDYYEENSGYNLSASSGMTIDYTVTEAVYSDHPLAYYGADGTDIDNGRNYGGDAADTGNIYELAREAVQKLDDKGFDFSSFDKDGDSVIDHLFIIHAGMGQEESTNTNLIWSHSWAINGGEETSDGVYAYNYVMVPETGQLGTFAHEFGHDIGLPDLYDTDYTSSGTGVWDLMSAGSWNRASTSDEYGSSPANLSAWSRMYMGWETPETVSQNGSKTIANETGISNVLKFWTTGDTDDDEYYLAEYRRQAGYDAGLPGEGLLVWHIDEDQILATFDYNAVNDDESRPGVGLEQADGNWDLKVYSDNQGDDGDPFPGSSNNMNFTAVPYGFNYSNIDTDTFSYVAVSNINVSGSAASAYYHVTASYPAAPSASKPADSAVTSTTPTFGWGISPQAEYFKLQVSTDPGFASGIKEYILDEKSDGISYTGNGYEYTVPSGALSADTLYYWRVAGFNSTSTSSNIQWTSIRSFTTVASYTEGITAPSVSFSFDGTNAGKLVGITTSMEYSLDGGTTYVQAAEADQLLTDEELDSITDANNIRVRLTSHTGAVKIIDILTGTTPSVTASNSSNTISGISTAMEFSIDNVTWTRYTGSNLPDLSGKITIYVRLAATGCYLQSSSKTLTFTKTTSSSSGGGGGGGSSSTTTTTTTTTATSIVDAGVVLHESSLLTQINDVTKTEIVIDIPTEAKEQSAAVDTSVLKKLADKGKSLTVISGSVELVLPAGAIGETQLASIGDASQLKLIINKVGLEQALQNGSVQKPGSGLTLVGGNMIGFSAELVSKDKTLAVTSFDASARITISLKGMSLSGIDTEKLGAYYYNENAKAWEYYGGSYDAASGTISFDTGHFSYYSVMEYYKTFTDIADHWSRSYVEKMASRYIAKGENGSFRPDATISRAEFTALLVRSLELKTAAADKSSSFTDVAAGKWYASEVGKAYIAGIASKEDGVTFRPDVEITREEIVVMVARALRYEGKGIELTEEQVEQRLGGFNDYEQVSESAREPFAIALEKGIVKGRTADTIAPKGNATRAEAIVMIYRLLNVK